MEKRSVEPEPPECSLKQICHPSRATEPSVVHEKVVPAVRDPGTVSEDSTSVPSIMRWSQQVSRLKVEPTVRSASCNIVTEQDSLLPWANG